MASQGARIFQRSSLKLFRRNISSSTTCRALDPTKKMNVAKHSFAAISLHPFSKQSVRHRTTGANVHSPLNNDGDSNYANRPPKETILLDGCDYEHWLIVMEFPKEPKPSEDEMINSYVKTLASIVGSEEEAKKKIYSVSTHTYTGFGALISEELSYKVKSLPGVLWVLPDSYIDVPNKDYGGDLFIDGKVIPRPQYRYPERHPGRNDRPRRNNRQFEQRRPPMQPNQMGGQPPNPAGQPPNPAGAQHHNLAGGWQQNQFRAAQANQMDGMQQNRPGGWQQNQPGGMPPMNRPGGMPPSQPPMQQYQQGGWQPNHNSAPSATEEPSHPNMAEASQFGNNQGSQ